MSKIKNFLIANKSDIIFVIIVAAVFTLFSSNFAVLHIRGMSMYPTYDNGNILLLKKGKTIANGDIIVFESPDSWGAQRGKFIKRIVAKPGDSVEIQNNKILVNDIVRDFTKTQCSQTEDISFKLSENEYIVMGDNSPESNDSITQYCMDNKEFTINKDSFVTYGKEFFVIGGMFK